MEEKQKPLGITLQNSRRPMAIRLGVSIICAAMAVNIGVGIARAAYLSTKPPEFQQLYSMSQMSEKKAKGSTLTQGIMAAAEDMGISGVTIWEGETRGTDAPCILLSIPMTEEQGGKSMVYEEKTMTFDETKKTFVETTEKQRVSGTDYLRLTIGDLLDSYIETSDSEDLTYQVNANGSGIIAMLGTGTDEYLANFAYVLAGHQDEPVEVQFELLKDSFDQNTNTI